MTLEPLDPVGIPASDKPIILETVDGSPERLNPEGVPARSGLRAADEKQRGAVRRPRPNLGLQRKALLLMIVFAIGFGGGFFTGRQTMPLDTSATSKKSMVMPTINEINPPAGYKIPITLGDIGPKLLEVGAIDLPALKELYKQSGRPSDEYLFEFLTQYSSSPPVITQKNAQFLLNFFWAFGLTNKNPILTEGAMMSGGKDKAGNFASTGGWTLGKKPPMELYASVSFLPMSEDQQARLLKVASSVYRPCCDNPTHFPDCNHGMAMLGLLEIMASQNASEKEMFDAAKYVNAFWFPQQTMEIATTIKATQNVSYTQADGSQIVSREYSSGTGFQKVHQFLNANGLLQQVPNGGGSCGV